MLNNIINFDVHLKSEYSSKGGVCQYIFRKEYAVKNNIKLNPDLAYGEDYLWAFQLSYRMHIGLIANVPLYKYRQRSNSAMHSKDMSKKLRHKDDMLKLAMIYKEEFSRCEHEGMSAAVLKDIKRRIVLCVQSVIWDSIRFLSKHELNSELKRLKENNLYPYHIQWWYLFDKKIKSNKIVRVATLFLPFKVYVKLLNMILSHK